MSADGRAGDNKWKLTRINEGWRMTRVEGNSIAIRPLRWYEWTFYLSRGAADRLAELIFPELTEKTDSLKSLSPGAGKEK